ncbi:class I SAM-dependent methyltransferase, partial [Myxococcota bacterium]|nr:class I SAM-dependent methyltransferase [Myxococcota bacterium]
RGRSPRAIAIDAAPGPLTRARHAVEGVDGVELRAGAGLAPLAAGEVDVAILAGLGGDTIADVVGRGAPATLGITRLVVQPNTEEPRVRRAIVEAGYSITEERFVADQERCFLVITADRSETPSKIFDMEDELLGPAAARVEDELFRAWLEGQVRWRARRRVKGGAGDAELDVLSRALERLRPR